MGLGKNALDCDNSYMFCQYGHGIIYFKDAGQTFKDHVEEKAEDELLITLDILQRMEVYDDGGNKIDLGVREIASYDLKSSIPTYKEKREFTQEDVDEINRVLYKYEINTPNRAAHFLAQCTAESNLGIGPVEKYGGDDVFDYFRVRDYRSDLGNCHKDDGAKFRGAGAIHMTGRSAHMGFQAYIAEEADGNIVDQGALYVGKYYFWESAGYYWHIYKNMNNKYFINGSTVDVAQITLEVNGGDSQRELREQAYLYLIKELKGRNCGL